MDALGVRTASMTWWEQQEFSTQIAIMGGIGFLGLVFFIWVTKSSDE